MRLESIIVLFEYYKSLGEKTFAQVPDEGLFWSPHPEANSIATLVKHLWGNMLSRWTDFLHSDGEKEWRDRDGEFESGDITDRETLLRYWEEGWQCLLDALGALEPDDLDKTIVIRGEPHGVLQAIDRQLAHYAYHVGQVVFLGKLYAGDQWQSLSIPKGKSKAFNASDKPSSPFRK